MNEEMIKRDTLRYCVSLMKDIKKSQRDLNKIKALEFVIDKLNAGIERSLNRSKVMQTEV